MITMLMVRCCTYITGMWGRYTGTRVGRGKCMTVKVWRRWHSRKTFIQDTLSRIRYMLG